MTLQCTQELAVYDALEVPDKRRENTCLVAFLSYCLFTFALPEDEKGSICPRTFEGASNLAAGCTFYLTVPVLASIYRGLSGIFSGTKPSNSMSLFSAHCLHG